MRKKLRKLAIDDRVFSWAANWSYVEGYRIVHLRVWAGEKASGHLAVDLTSKWWSYPVDASYPRPHDVRQIIQFGLTHGWSPDIDRRPFWLTEHMTTSLDLDHLFVTDFGRIPTSPPPHRSVAPNP